MPPKSSSDELPVIANGMSLRGHRSKNVGAPDMKRPRRSNGEVAAEKAEKAQMKVSIDKMRKQSLRKVAAVEQAAKLADKENHHHPFFPMRSKVIRDEAEELAPDSEDEREREREEKIQKNAEKKAKKRLTRRLIEAELATMDSGNAPVKIKRKADNAAIAEFSAKKAKTVKNPIGGLRADWMIKDNVPLQAPHPHVNDQDSDREPIGGISDDDSISGERAALDINPTGPRFKSLAKVNLTPVVPIPQLSAKRQQTLLRKKKITRNDVPDGIRREFYDKYIPYAIRLAGYKDAWYNPTYTDAYKSWIAVLAHSDKGSYGQPSSEHISIAEKLINNTLSQVRNRTKEAAIKALDILLRDEKKTTIDEKKDYVKWLQGGGLYDNAPPFYYKVFNAGANKRKGPFQSFLITFTFSLHLAAISGVPDNVDNEKQSAVQQPGALVMAVQAVKRALFYYRSGVKEEPNPRDTLSHFSHSNWADHNEIIIDDYGESITKLIPTTTSIQKLVEQLTATQWAKINQEAAQFMSKETEPPSPATIGSYNENPELIDDDSDEDNSQPQQRPAPHDDDFDQWQPSTTGEPVDAAPDDLLDFAGSDMDMRGPTDDEEDSITESDPDMPGVTPSRSTIKWFGWEGDSEDPAVKSDSGIHSDSDEEHE